MPIAEEVAKQVWEYIRKYNEETGEPLSQFQISKWFEFKAPKNFAPKYYVDYLMWQNRIELKDGKLWAVENEVREQ